MPETHDDDLERLPGLFRAWDLMQVLVPGAAYRVEDAGATEDGAPLFAVYRAPETDFPPQTGEGG